MSQCISGEWVSSPHSVTCKTDTGILNFLSNHRILRILNSCIDACPTSACNPETGNSISGPEIMAIAAVASFVCGITTGSVLCVLLTQCHMHCRRAKEKRCQNDMAGVYEDIPVQNTTEPLHLKTNEAYGQIRA